MTTETSLSPLYTAQRIVRDIDASRKELEEHLAPFLAQYIELMSEINPRYHDDKDKEASTFSGVDGKLFVFVGEEYYEYGEYETPTVELPFDFVEDPEAYAEKERKRIADEAAKFTRAQRESQQSRIDSLRRQLDAAENVMKTLPVDN